jgi:hypoxanthine phosphoribosyltransferase
MGPRIHSDLNLLWSSHEIDIAIKRVASAVNDAYADYSSVNLVPVLTGAMPFATGLGMELERLCPGKWRLAPVFVSTYQNDGLIRSPVIEFPSKFGDAVDPIAPAILIDDLLDTGTTMGTLVHEMKQAGFADVAVCVLVDKPAARLNELKPEFYALLSETEAWLVGYGMDTQMRYRFLDGIYTLDPGPLEPKDFQLGLQIS